MILFDRIFSLFFFRTARLLLLVGLLWPAAPTWAQNGPAPVVVEIRDSLTATPLRFATIRYGDARTLADSVGRAVLAITAPTALTVSYVGFTDWQLRLVAPADTVQIRLYPTTELLQELTVRGRKQLLEFLLDRTVLTLTATSSTSSSTTRCAACRG